MAAWLGGVLTIQSGHDGLAQCQHQPQRGTEEEEARYLKIEAGAGAFHPVPWCLCLQRGLAGLQAGTAGPVGMGSDCTVPIPPAWGQLCAQHSPISPEGLLEAGKPQPDTPGQAVPAQHSCPGWCRWESTE